MKLLLGIGSRRILLLEVFFVLICSFFFCSYGRRTRGPRWWRLGKVVDPSDLMSNEILSNSLSDPHIPESVLKLLRKKQRKLIRVNQGSLVSVTDGTRMALQGCQQQFKDRRWNCTPPKSRKPSLFGKIVSIPCRETAFVYAMTAASVLHSVTRACTEGLIQSCACDYSARGARAYPQVYEEQNNHLLPPNNLHTLPEGKTWKWGGCSENVNFGYRFSKQFVDAGEKGRDLNSIMNLHNSEAGRLHVTTKMRSECKCHGMSGSCAVKSCWKRLPRFKHIGEALKDRFDGASQVIGTREMSSRPNDRRRIIRWNKTRKSRKFRMSFRPINPEHKPPSRKDLIYVDKSPNFCVRNKKLGIAGTHGRECNATSRGLDGCELMCCGRGYRSALVQVRERCSCTFQWCCEVKCKICLKEKIIHTCR